MEHHHSIPNLLPLLPIIFVMFVYLKIRISKFKALVILVLLSFSFVHLNPQKLVFTNYHQTSNHSSSQHPCCVPHFFQPVLAFEIEVPSYSNAKTTNTSLSINTFFIQKNVNSRSPPFS